MIKKRRFRKEGVVKVTFCLPSEVQASDIRLYGDFNAWQDAIALRRERDGSWKTTVELEPDRTYQFKYRVDGERWINDPQADGYAPNPYGDDNSILTT